MKKLLLPLMILVSVLILTTSQLPAQEQRIKASYSIELINPDRMLFGIEARFDFPSKLDSVVFKMENTDNHYTRGYAQFVKQINLYGRDSAEIPLEKQEPDKWVAKNLKGKYLLKYIIPIQHPGSVSEYGIDETPFYIEPSGVLIGTGMIIYPQLPLKSLPENFEIKFNLGQNMTAVLPQKNLGENRFIMPSLEYVINAFWAVGAYDTLTIGDERFPLRIAVQKEFLKDLNDQLLGNLRRLWDQTTQVFDIMPEFPPVLLISRFPMSDKNPGIYNAGASSPGSISILLDDKITSEQLDSYFGLFAYNFVPQWIPITFFPLNRASENWLIRGVANYYQLLLVRRVGLIDDQEFLNRLLLMYEQYCREYDRRGISVRAARDIANTDAYLTAAEVLTVCMMDLRLRSETKSTASFDKVISALANRFHGASNVFSRAQFFELVDTVSGQYLMPFVDSCLNLPEKIDLPGMFAKFGVKLEVIPDGKVNLGAIFNSYTDLTVADVDRGGPASQADLQAGDKIVKVDGKEFTDVNSLAAYLDGKKAGNKIKIEYMRGDKTSKTRLELGGNDLYKISREASPTSGQDDLWNNLVSPLGQ